MGKNFFLGGEIFFPPILKNQGFFFYFTPSIEIRPEFQTKKRGKCKQTRKWNKKKDCYYHGAVVGEDIPTEDKKCQWDKKKDKKNKWQ